MYKKEFDIYLRTHIPRATLLYGESDFLIQAYSKQILRTLGFIPQIFYYVEYVFEDVLGILSQSSLFGDRQCVVLKLDKKPSDKEINAMLNAVKQNPDNALIVEFYCAENKTPSQYARDFRALSSIFKNDAIEAIALSNTNTSTTHIPHENKPKNGVVEVRFFTPTPKEAIEFLRQKADELHISITNANLEALLIMQNFDIGIACSELTKFAILEKPIEQKDIAFLCYGLGNVEVDDLLLSLFSKGKPLEIFTKMLEAGVNEIALLSELERYFYQLFLFAAHIRLYGRADTKEILGYAAPSFVAQTLSERALAIKERAFLEIFKLFGSWRNELMRGTKSISMRCLMKLQAFIR